MTYMSGWFFLFSVLATSSCSYSIFFIKIQSKFLKNSHFIGHFSQTLLKITIRTLGTRNVQKTGLGYYKCFHKRVGVLKIFKKRAKNAQKCKKCLTSTNNWTSSIPRTAAFFDARGTPSRGY